MWRVDKPRGHGASSLYAYGYMELAELFGSAPWEVAEAVVDGLLDPLHLLELAIAHTHGLGHLSTLAEGKATVWSGVTRQRPEHVLSVLSVRLGDTERIWGLSDLWAIDHNDIAAQTWREPAQVYDAHKAGAFLISDLASVVAYLVESMDDRQRKLLKLG